MDYAAVVNQILALFLIIFSGLFLRCRGIITKELQDGLFKLLVDFILPALIISAMQIELKQELINNIILISLFWFITYILLIITVSILGKFSSLPPSKKSTYQFMMIFGNVGYMGLPVLRAVFPEYGVFYASLGMVIINIFMWTYGVILFNKNDDKKFEIRSIFNNGVIALIIGLFFLFTGIELPVSVSQGLEMLGDATFPISMLIIGSSLYGIKLKSLFLDFRILVISIIKLLIIPVFLFLFFGFFDLPSIVVG
ncbi:MAG: AEC family transporter, partial [Halanaerobiales bacterium]